MANYSEEFLKKTVEVWQPFSEEPLSLEDARSIAANAAALFAYLAELDQKYGPQKKKT